MEVLANAAAYLWLPLGVLALGCGAAGLGCALAGKGGAWPVLLILSLGCGALTLLAEYLMAYAWVLREDWSALADVVPGMSGVLVVCTVLGIALNAAALAVGLRRRR